MGHDFERRMIHAGNRFTMYKLEEVLVVRVVAGQEGATKHSRDRYRSGRTVSARVEISFAQERACAGQLLLKQLY